MNENTRGDFLLHGDDRATLRRHAKMRVYIEADRITGLRDDEVGALREAISRIRIMRKILDVVGWDPQLDNTQRAIAVNEELMPVSQIRAWVEQHFVPEDRQAVTDCEGETTLDLGKAIDGLGKSLSLQLRLRQHLAAEHDGDEIAGDAADAMVGGTALELARLAKRMMDEAEKAIGLPGDDGIEAGRVGLLRSNRG